MSTTRQAMKELLTQHPYSSLELSQLLSQSEKEVLEHLAHLARASGTGWHFRIIPSVCKNCGFVFRKRDRLTRPAAALSASINPSAARAFSWWKNNFLAPWREKHFPPRPKDAKIIPPSRSWPGSGAGPHPCPEDRRYGRPASAAASPKRWATVPGAPRAR